MGWFVVGTTLLYLQLIPDGCETSLLVWRDARFVSLLADPSWSPFVDISALSTIVEFWHVWLLGVDCHHFDSNCHESGYSPIWDKHRCTVPVVCPLNPHISYIPNPHFMTAWLEFQIQNIDSYSSYWIIVNQVTSRNLDLCWNFTKTLFKPTGTPRTSHHFPGPRGALSEVIPFEQAVAKIRVAAEAASRTATLRWRWRSHQQEPSMTGWWFGTFFNFPYIGNNHPNWLMFFRGGETTNQMMIIYDYRLCMINDHIVDDLWYGCLLAMIE